MIARGALGNPWLFEEITARLEGRSYAPPSKKERISEALSQIEQMIEEKGEYVADARYKDVEGGHFVEGNLPRNESQGVHTVDDLVVTAQGPNSEQIRGFMNSTEVFRVMAEALALGK